MMRSHPTGGVQKLKVPRRWAVGGKSVAEVPLEGREDAQREAISGVGGGWELGLGTSLFSGERLGLELCQKVLSRLEPKVFKLLL